MQVCTPRVRAERWAARRGGVLLVCWLRTGSAEAWTSWQRHRDHGNLPLQFRLLTAGGKQASSLPAPAFPFSLPRWLPGEGAFPQQTLGGLGGDCYAASPCASVGSCDKAPGKATRGLQEITGEMASEGTGLSSFPAVFLLPGWSP